MARALRIVRRRAAREQALAQAVSEYRDRYNDLVTAATSGNEPPREVTRAMRAPVGPDRLVVISHDGMLIKAALRPSGKRSPQREAAIWDCMRETAIALREERR